MVAELPQRDILVDWGLERGEVVLGEGSLGEVRRGRYIGAPVAIKRLAKDDAEWGEMLAEVRALLRLSHPLLVQLLGVLEEEGGRALVMELAPGSLHDLLYADRALLASKRLDPTPWHDSPGFVAAMLLDCAGALDFLHSQSMPHQSLKASNVLVFHGFRCKLSDVSLRRRTKSAEQPSANADSLSLKASLAMDVLAMGVLVRTSKCNMIT